RWSERAPLREWSAHQRLQLERIAERGARCGVIEDTPRRNALGAMPLEPPLQRCQGGGVILRIVHPRRTVPAIIGKFTPARGIAAAFDPRGVGCDPRDAPFGKPIAYPGREPARMPW